jgi:hypothetical protein
LNARPAAQEARPSSRNRRGLGCRRCREPGKKNEALEQEMRRVKAHNRRLERQPERTERAGRRQAAPFANGQAQAESQEGGPPAGAEYGIHARRKVPTHVDQTIDGPCRAHAQAVVAPSSPRA